MKRVVYVTGCLGFIGFHVAQACLARGWYVRGVDKGTYAANWNLLPILENYKNFTFEHKDINDLDRIYDCDYFINTAAETHVDNSLEESDCFVHSNINGVHHILKLINQKKYRKPIFLHFSTDEVYGDIEVGSHTEDDTLAPSNPYSATKAAADMLVIAWGRSHKLPYIIVRPTNNYGIGQYVEKLIPKTCKFLTLGKKIDLHNNGTPVRTWLNAKDTAQAVITIIEAGVVNEIYNISGPYQTENINVVKKIFELFGINDDPSNHITHMERQGQDIRYSIDDTKLRKLGWNPQAVFDDELKDIVKYYTENFIW